VRKKIFFFLKPSGLMDRDTVAGFREEGHDVRVHTLRMGQTRQGHEVQFFSTKDIIETLDSFRPDMIFSFNGFGLDKNGILARAYESRGIPFVTWFVDMPQPADLGTNFVAGNSYIFVFDRIYISLLNEAGFNRIDYLPLATNPHRFRNINGVVRRDTVCFVGESDYKTIQYAIRNIGEMVGTAAPAFLDAMDASITQQIRMPENDAWSIVTDVFPRYGQDVSGYPEVLKNLIAAFIEREASLRQRLAIISGVAKRFNTVVYGDDLWANVVSDGFRGRAHYFNDEIVEAYNASSIYVNVSKYQLKQAINQRPFDISACGGFVLTDERADLRTLFTEREIISYATLDDLVDKIAYYREHEKTRTAIAHRARTRVLADHTYQCRSRTIMMRLFQ